ncbi:uncharacterized protein [Lepisosteus oculatus]
MAPIGKSVTETKKPTRIPLVCKMCLNTFDQLPAHLKRACMKHATAEEIRMASQQARKDMINLLKNGVIVDYNRIEIVSGEANRAVVVRLLESLGLFVRGKPKDTLARGPEQEAAVHEEEMPEAAPETEAEAEEEGEDVSSEELYQQPRVVKKYQQALRKRVAQAGLYRKHSLDAPLLIGFKQYLTKDLGVANYSQEVDNVSRFLFFMDQTAPSLNFVKDIRKTRDFFNEMKTIGLSHQTIANYIKNINRFLRYILNATNVRVMDPTLANFIINFQSILKDVQRKNSKDVTQEITRKRYRQLQQPEPNTTECWKVLRVAKKDVLHVLGKTYSSEEITGAEQLLVMYYLQAVLQLKHLQRPGVVKNMTVEEWMQRKSVVSPSGQKMVIIGVKEHKTASQQLASFALNEEEEHMFHVYFTQLRSNAKDSSCGQEEEKFFISSNGDPIYNPSNDLRRLHKKYCLPFITSQVARRAFETAAINVTDAQKSIVADYLAHSNSTAEKHYRMLTHANICSAIEVIEGFAEEGSQ